MNMPIRVKLTDEVCKAIEFCSVPIEDESKECTECPLRGACLEYWTGDSSHNMGWEK